MANVIKVGDKVRHDFSRELGTVKAIQDVNEDTSGYDYLVEWVLQNGETRQDWMKRVVLEKVE